ncbi:T9SS type A sorting domain-containing protein [Flavobacterium sp. SUN052]|uniref:T9SS type A sorting domain-containing protein n=1 Tax=Flavobacterium sp. SUN052 TaxID=3002441 RepID=UPI00237D8699|nr:T9SS type A sorting domain-containing protein [Flavobacterium sp. SUN052]MEC4004363.1 T9SS type A sorting domain-containing protein [Flavobacterium sp. SUN052]
MKQKYTFLLMIVFCAFKVTAQNNYSVTSIPFQQFSTSSPVLGTMDDKYSDVIALPFSFDFYGTTFNNLLISTNGYIDFRTNLANGSSPFYFTQAIPNTAFSIKNSIMGAFSDLNNTNAQGNITYGLYGTAPYRKFIVYFYNNSLFQCNAAHSSFQIILHETSNIIDVQLIDKQICNPTSTVKAVTGLINLAGNQGIAPPGRNYGSWSAFHEGWRFSRAGYYPNYSFVKCDDNTDGFVAFDLNIAATDLAISNPIFYTDQALTMQISNPNAYVNTINNESIYITGNGIVRNIKISVVDCTIDADNDSVPTSFEDINNDTNLANDDSDGDGIPNYVDNDDDGDLILTNVEYVFTNKSASTIVDTDNDTIPNYLDSDDDGDGILTFNEDYNGDGNPLNDDTNNDGQPDYLQSSVALGLINNELSTTIELFPNPASDILNIANSNNETINLIAIYSINGSLIKEIKPTGSLQSIAVSDLQSGIYFVKLEINDSVLNYKFIKK